MGGFVRLIGMVPLVQNSLSLVAVALFRLIHSRCLYNDEEFVHRALLLAEIAMPQGNLPICSNCLSPVVQRLLVHSPCLGNVLDALIVGRHHPPDHALFEFFAVSYFLAASLPGFLLCSIPQYLVFVELTTILTHGAF